jgi:hypothetical protein
MTPKPWYASKTLWVGLITFVYGILQFTGVVTAELSEATMATILGVVIVILRFLTKSELEW